MLRQVSMSKTMAAAIAARQAATAALTRLAESLSESLTIDHMPDSREAASVALQGRVEASPV